jgi:hypothetical protein
MKSVSISNVASLCNTNSTQLLEVIKPQNLVDTFMPSSKPNILLQKDFIQNIPKIEEDFVKNPNYSDYLKIAKSFKDNYQSLNTSKFTELEKFLLTPLDTLKNHPKINDYPYLKEQLNHEKWLLEHQENFIKEEKKEIIATKIREQKIQEYGLGITGNLTTINHKVKNGGFYIKNNLTLRGNIEQITEDIFGQSLYELLPRYKSRKTAHIGIKISEFGINTFLMAAGSLLIPVTFGVSKVISDHSRTVITLSGDAIDKKMLGASNNKIKHHALLQGIQMEIPKFIPIAGDIIQYTEAGLEGLGVGTITSSILAEIILSNVSQRFHKILSKNDLGNPRVIKELDDRIDYLSKFLIPYGEYILLTQNKPIRQKQLRQILAEQLSILRTLEKRRTKALQFYKLALIAEKVPPEEIENVKKYTIDANLADKINGHKVARRCLGSIIEKIPETNFFI